MLAVLYFLYVASSEGVLKCIFKEEENTDINTTKLCNQK